MPSVQHGKGDADEGRRSAPRQQFSVSIPSDIGWYLRPGLATPPVDVHGLEGPWVEISGAGIPRGTLARVERTGDGRFVVTGLVLGLHQHREITWQTLRDLRPASVIAEIFAGIDPLDPAAAVEETDPGMSRRVEDPENFDAVAWIEADWDDDDDPLIDLSSQQWREHRRAMAALALWQETDRQRPAEAVTMPGARLATDLAQFAATYSKHRAATPHKATKATADELHISRATALRRIKECQSVGLLPNQRAKS